MRRRIQTLTSDRCDTMRFAYLFARLRQRVRRLWTWSRARCLYILLGMFVLWMFADIRLHGFPRRDTSSAVYSPPNPRPSRTSPSRADKEIAVIGIGIGAVGLVLLVLINGFHWNRTNRHARFVELLHHQNAKDDLR